MVKWAREPQIPLPNTIFPTETASSSGNRGGNELIIYTINEGTDPDFEDNYKEVTVIVDPSFVQLPIDITGYDTTFYRLFGHL